MGAAPPQVADRRGDEIVGLPTPVKFRGTRTTSAEYYTVDDDEDLEATTYEEDAGLLGRRPRAANPNRCST